jgi:hypothetical protein
VLTTAVFPVSAQQQSKAQVGFGGVLESKVRKAWEDYKTKNKADLASLLADDFRIIQDGDAAFTDKKADVEEVDALNVRDYNLSNFTVTLIGKDGGQSTRKEVRSNSNFLEKSFFLLNSLFKGLSASASPSGACGSCGEPRGPGACLLGDMT